MRELRGRIGPIYGLVNNAGLGAAGLLATMPDADIEALIRLNTLSPILMSKYVVRGMMAKRRGRVVNIASIVASTGFNAPLRLRRHQGFARRFHEIARARSRASRT